MRTIDECPSRGGTGSLRVVRFLKNLPFLRRHEPGRTALHGTVRASVDVAFSAWVGVVFPPIFSRVPHRL
jgi:hypothetical protein